MRCSDLGKRVGFGRRLSVLHEKFHHEKFQCVCVGGGGGVFWTEVQNSYSGVFDNKFLTQGKAQHHTVSHTLCMWRLIKFLHCKLQPKLVLLNCVPTLVNLDCFSHSITMEALTPTRCKTANIHRIEHSPVQHTNTNS